MRYGFVNYIFVDIVVVLLVLDRDHLPCTVSNIFYTVQNKICDREQNNYYYM